VVDIYEIWYGGGLYAVIFISIVSTILEWFRFTFKMKLKISEGTVNSLLNYVTLN
jgi:uncharacterized membrane protein YdbT with pleckstrin-like domain